MNPVVYMDEIGDLQVWTFSFSHGGYIVEFRLPYSGETLVWSVSPGFGPEDFSLTKLGTL